MSLVEAMFESVKLLYRQVDQADLSAFPGNKNVSEVMGMQDRRTVNDNRLNVAGVDKRDEDRRQGLNKGRFASNSWTNPRFLQYRCQSEEEGVHGDGQQTGGEEGDAEEGQDDGDGKAKGREVVFCICCLPRSTGKETRDMESG